MHPRLAGLSLRFAVASLAATNVAADTAAIERCRDEATAEARIACLEAELAGLATGSPAGVIETSPPALSQEADIPAEPLVRELPPEAPVTMDQVEVAVGTDDTAEKEPATELSGIGAEQVRAARHGTEPPQQVAGLPVAHYATVPFRRLEVHLANGQVWRQIKGDTQEVNANLRKNRTVDIEESTLGGYKLRLNEMQRTIRVRRVK